MAARSKPCPICERPATKANAPFCSDRCKQVDLNRWLDGSYAIPAAESDAPDAEDYAASVHNDPIVNASVRSRPTKH